MNDIQTSNKSHINNAFINKKAINWILSPFLTLKKKRNIYGEKNSICFISVIVLLSLTSILEFLKITHVYVLFLLYLLLRGFHNCCNFWNQVFLCSTILELKFLFKSVMHWKILCSSFFLLFRKRKTLKKSHASHIDYETLLALQKYFNKTSSFK